MSHPELDEYDPEEEKMLLSDVLDRVLSTGVTITGDLTIGIADVSLIYCGIRVLLTTVDKLKEQNTPPLTPEE
ncbi:MAG: gas vesicle protein [Cyclobacteriaceae bacterium]